MKKILLHILEELGDSFSGKLGSFARRIILPIWCIYTICWIFNVNRYVDICCAVIMVVIGLILLLQYIHEECEKIELEHEYGNHLPTITDLPAPPRKEPKDKELVYRNFAFFIGVNDAGKNCQYYGKGPWVVCGHTADCWHVILGSKEMNGSITSFNSENVSLEYNHPEIKSYILANPYAITLEDQEEL